MSSAAGTASSASSASSSSSAAHGKGRKSVGGRGKGGKGVSGGKGGKGGKGQALPVAAAPTTAEGLTTSNASFVKAFADNAQAYPVFDHEKVDGPLCVGVRDLAKKIIATGNHGAAKIVLDAHTIAVAGTIQDGGTALEARLHSTLPEAMLNEENGTNEKLFHLAAGMQQGLVALDGIMVIGTGIVMHARETRAKNLPTAVYQVAVALLADNVANLQGEVARLASTGLPAAPAQGAQAAPMVAARGPSAGTTPSALRKLKKLHLRNVLVSPTQYVRSQAGRQAAGLTYSHHPEMRVLPYLRELLTADPNLFGGSTLDSILGLDTEGKDIPLWMKTFGNARSKFTELAVLQLKKLDFCSKSLGIREGEDASSAMRERVIDLATVALNLYNIVHIDDEVNIGDLEDAEEFLAMMAAKGMNWEILAYLGTVCAIKMFPEFRAMGDAISLRNPLQGTVFWFITQEFLLYTVATYHVDIPGLSRTDGTEDKLSSHATVAALATAKLAALTAVCEEQDVKVPDYSQFFFQTYVPEILEEDDAADDGLPESEGSDGDEDDGEDDDEESQVAGQDREPAKKKAKKGAATGRKSASD